MALCFVGFCAGFIVLAAALQWLSPRIEIVLFGVRTWETVSRVHALLDDRLCTAKWLARRLISRM